MRQTRPGIARHRLQCDFQEEPDNGGLFENKSLSLDFAEFAEIMHRLLIGSGSQPQAQIERAPRVGKITGAQSPNTRTRYAQ